ncbi:hypothetical protein [Nocardia sp. alder85J]|uniref:hypothetical protein n=1 Tax=Nocardia sp. alder85J TaxID=2862949 RepID=UPI001CD35A2E|nr:hypothetical protein [Nocardia sp. alder85J]MCX4092993.1 hypothetical protein [Nocardia sp. alder85J]
MFDRIRRPARGLTVTLGAVLVLGAGQAAAAPIPQEPGSAPGFSGSPATAQPITGIPAVPQHPYLAPGASSNIHDDGWMTNTYPGPGPLGVAPQTNSLLLGSECGSIAFDRAGRIVTACLGADTALYLIDPVGLRVLGSYPLPRRAVTDYLRQGAFSDFTGGGYFYLDNAGRAVIGTHDDHVLVLAETAAADGFTLQRDDDLRAALHPDEIVNSVLPDSTGRFWFVARTDGAVGTIDPETGAVQVIRLGTGADGEIENSFAVGADGDVYLATDHELLRFDAGPHGEPAVTWRVTYANSGRRKPGQVDAGTGTTPALLPGGYVAVTDNADPMNVVVYRTAPNAAARQVCSVPVFAPGASATENSLIAAGRSLVVENNFGYTGPEATLLGRTTTPGFARVDLDADGRGCHREWSTDAEAGPTVVPKLSLATGLIYTYTKGSGPEDPWYWTALDFRTGRTVWKQLSGAGPLFNNNYSGIALGPDGTAYLGVLGGLISVRDR